MNLSIEQRVGLFFLIGLVLLAVMIELVEDWQPFETNYAYHTYFESSVGLKVGDPVRLAGVEVGKITRIGIEGLRVRIDFEVADGTEIRADSVASVRQLNLLGGQFLGLNFGTAEAAILPPESAVRSVQGANIDELITNLDRSQRKVFGSLGNMIEEYRSSFGNILNQLEEITTKVNSGQGLVGKLINDDVIYDDLKLTMSSLRNITARLDQQDVGADLGATLANLREITDRLKNGEGTAGRLLTDETLYNDTQRAMQDLAEIARKANSGEGTFGQLLNDEELYADFREAMARIRNIATKIDEGEGTIGKLVNDNDIYRDAKTTLYKLEKAVDGLNDSGSISTLGTAAGTLF